jgi:hypothetical protein
MTKKKRSAQKPAKKVAAKKRPTAEKPPAKKAAANCLPLPKAIVLVQSCAGGGPDIPLSTKLGTLFPSANRRNQFCQCVADGVPINRSKIPCGANNTLQDVVDAIKC